MRRGFAGNGSRSDVCCRVVEDADPYDENGHLKT